jgi:hypothetical protein
MALDLSKILENDALFFKAISVLSVFGFSLIPGGIFLLTEKTSLFVNLEFSKLIFASFLISVPFNILGAALYFSPYRSLVQLGQLQVQGKVLLVVVSAFVWGTLSVGVLFIFTRLPFNPVNDAFSGNFALKYVANYTIFLAFLMIMLAVNLRKLISNNQTNSDQC